MTRGVPFALSFSKSGRDSKKVSFDKPAEASRMLAAALTGSARTGLMTRG
jgi:hypothetical protein